MRRKRRKLNFKKFMLFLFFFILFVFLIYNYFTFDTKNIYIVGNEYIEDQEIIDIAKLNNYPNFYITSKKSIENKIRENQYIKNVVVEKKWLGKFYITITEEKALFYKSGNIVLEDGKEISEEKRLLQIPTLMNYVDDQYYDSLVNNMNGLNDCIISKISQIEYKPNDIDLERFLLYMKDGNYVYLTLLNFDKMNSYNEILLELEGKNGIMYLDSGNYFEILK